MADTVTNYDSLKDFISPLGISLITIYVTYIFSRLGDFITKQNDLRSKRLSYIDFFSLELNKLILAFDNLLVDLDEGVHEYQSKNYGAAESALTELKKMIPDVVIFSEESLRKKIIDTIDLTFSLVIGIRALEDIKNQWKAKYDNTISSTQYEVNNLRIELFKLNIELTNQLSPRALINKKIDKRQEDYINRIINDINMKKTNAWSEWNNSLSFCKDKRTVLSTRILDTKSKLNELASDFDILKDDIQRKKFLIF